MNEKIGWYREVLELEPDSRLFYPLAKLLVEEGELEEACRVLAEGVARHPSYMEARLYHIELLRRTHRSSETELAGLRDIFARHAGFWQAWAASTREDSPDAALAMRLLSLVVRGVDVSFTDILRRGLDSLEAELGLESPAQGIPAPQAGVAGAVQAPRPAAPATPAAPAAAAVEPILQPDNPLSSIQAAADSLARAAAAPAAGPAVRAAEPAAEPLVLDNPLPGDDEDQESEDVWPPRTRSMAEVLVEQGEYGEALDIYNELLARAGSDALRQELAARLAEIEALVRGRGAESGEQEDEEAETAAPSAPAQDDDRPAGTGTIVPPVSGVAAPGTSGGLDMDASPLPGKELISMLETLADRVEARIH